jgi:hypothetical protein
VTKESYKNNSQDEECRLQGRVAVGYVRTDVSEKLAASIFRAKESVFEEILLSST